MNNGLVIPHFKVIIIMKAVMFRTNAQTNQQYLLCANPKQMVINA